MVGVFLSEEGVKRVVARKHAPLLPRLFVGAITSFAPCLYLSFFY